MASVSRIGLSLVLVLVMLPAQAAYAVSPVSTTVPRNGWVPRLDGSDRTQFPDRGDGRTSGRPGVLAGGVRWRHLRIRKLTVSWVNGSGPTEQASGGNGRHTFRKWLLACGRGRRDLQLWRCRFPWIYSQHRIEFAGRGHERHPQRRWLLAQGPPTEGYPPSATRSSRDRWGPCDLTNPLWVWRDSAAEEATSRPRDLIKYVNVIRAVEGSEGPQYCQSICLMILPTRFVFV